MIIETIEQLESVYDAPVPAAAKVSDLNHLIPPYAKLIEASPFFLLATNGPQGLDCSARGDPVGFVRVTDDRTIMFPDRRGNNKIDSLRNIISDPRVSLLFLVPPTGIILRVNGRARISIAENLLTSFAVGSALPKSVTIVTVEAAFLQCARAIMRSKLWDRSSYADEKAVPTMGDVLAYASKGSEGGKKFDEAAPTRMSQSLW
ncbi:MAG: flavin-nucleotide-binding protein [Sphingomonadales bacterium 32-64-17]|nr:MAG: flavin-nucleotide-binding protein [Sphingomonadales bacterium 32-64-17]